MYLVYVCLTLTMVNVLPHARCRIKYDTAPYNCIVLSCFGVTHLDR
jgi:hypothetical protein